MFLVVAAHGAGNGRRGEFLCLFGHERRGDGPYAGQPPFGDAVLDGYVVAEVAVAGLVVGDRTAVGTPLVVYLTLFVTQTAQILPADRIGSGNLSG